MQRLEVTGAVRPLCGSLGVKGLSAFEKLQIAITYVMSICCSVRLSVRKEQLGSHWTDFHEI